MLGAKALANVCIENHLFSWNSLLLLTNGVIQATKRILRASHLLAFRVFSLTSRVGLLRQLTRRKCR